MKWEKRGPKKRSKLQPRPPRLPLWRERSVMRLFSRITGMEARSGSHRPPPNPTPPRSQPCPDWPQRCTTECPVMMLCWGLWGQCLAQGHFSSCYRGREEHYMVGLSTSEIQHKLSCFFLFSAVRSKARHYVKLLMRPKYILLHLHEL